MNKEQILQQLQWRYAVKRFDATKKVSSEDWNFLEETLRLSPSSYGLQPWKFILVQNPEVRKKLRAASRDQSQVEECSHFLVMATRTEIAEKDIDRHVQNMAKTRGVGLDTLAGYKAVILGSLVDGPRSTTIKYWAQRQSYIAMGFLMESAALLNIDTCPMEGLDPLAYDKILNLENSGYATVAAVAVGYRHPEDKYQRAQKVRFSKTEIFQTI